MRVAQTVAILPPLSGPHASNASAGRRALQVLTSASLVVTAVYVAARCSSDAVMAHWLDCLHWTVAYVAAAALAWLGVRCSDGHVRDARRWFAYGLTSNALGQLLFDLKASGPWTPNPTLPIPCF